MLASTHVVSISAAFACWLALSSSAAANSEMIRLPLTRRVVEQDEVPFPSLFGKRDAVSVPVYNTIQYAVDINIGTPAVPMTVAVDTGSADLWIPSTSCPITECPYSRFDPSQSSTFKQDNTSVTIDYTYSTVTGSIATDNIQLGSVTIDSQQLCMAIQVPGIYSGAISMPGKFPNGVLGLGYQDREGNSWDRTGVMNKLGISSFSLYVDDPTVSLAYASSQGGELILGGGDSSKFTGGSLTYLPSAPNAFTIAINQQWALYGQRIEVGELYGVDLPDNTAVVLTTLIPFMVLPESLAKPVVESLVGKDNYEMAPTGLIVVKCKAAKESSATLQLQFSDSSTKSSQPVQVEIPTSALIMSEAGEACLLNIRGGAEVEGRPTYMIGASILRHLYLDFSLSEHKVGLAPTIKGKVTVTTLNADKGASTQMSPASPQPSVLPMTAALLIFAATGLLVI